MSFIWAHFSHKLKKKKRIILVQPPGHYINYSLTRKFGRKTEIAVILKYFKIGDSESSGLEPEEHRSTEFWNPMMLGPIKPPSFSLYRLCYISRKVVCYKKKRRDGQRYESYLF